MRRVDPVEAERDVVALAGPERFTSPPHHQITRRVGAEHLTGLTRDISPVRSHHREFRVQISREVEEIGTQEHHYDAFDRNDGRPPVHVLRARRLQARGVRRRREQANAERHCKRQDPTVNF